MGKKTMAIVIAIFVTISFPASASQSDSISLGPKIVFQTLNYDLGLHPIKQHALLKQNIPFSNKGNDSLLILNVKSNCGMLRVNCSSYRLEPGESGELQLTFDIPEAEAVQGALTRTVTLTTNDPKNRSIVITIVSRFGFSLYCIPARIDFGKVPKDADQTTSFALVSNTPDKFSISKYAYDKKLVSYSVLKDASAVRVDSQTSAIKFRSPHMIFSLKLKKGLPAGQIAETFQVNTDRKDIPVLAIPIVGQVVDDIEITPGDIFVGVLKVGATFTAKIRIVSADPNFKILSCKSKLAGCESTINNQAGAHSVTIQFKPVDKQQCDQNGSFENFLNITTNSPKLPTIRIKVYGVIS